MTKAKPLDNRKRYTSLNKNAIPLYTVKRGEFATFSGHYFLFISLAKVLLNGFSSFKLYIAFRIKHDRGVSSPQTI